MLPNEIGTRLLRLIRCPAVRNEARSLQCTGQRVSTSAEARDLTLWFASVRQRQHRRTITGGRRNPSTASSLQSDHCAPAAAATAPAAAAQPVDAPLSDEILMWRHSTFRLFVLQKIEERGTSSSRVVELSRCREVENWPLTTRSGFEMSTIRQSASAAGPHIPLPAPQTDR